MLSQDATPGPGISFFVRAFVSRNRSCRATCLVTCWDETSQVHKNWISAAADAGSDSKDIGHFLYLISMPCAANERWNSFLVFLGPLRKKTQSVRDKLLSEIPTTFDFLNSYYFIVG